MDNLGYIANRKFIIIGVEKRFEVLFNEMTVVLERAKKVYKLNEVNLISAIGNYYKMTDIYKYILKLNDLGHNGTFDQIDTDLNDVFNASTSSIIKDLEELKEIVPKFLDESGYIKREIFEFLKDKPHLLKLLQETNSSVANSHPGLTHVILFGWENKLKRTRLAHYISVANTLSGGEAEMQPNYFYARLVSSLKGTKETQEIESEIAKTISPLINDKWDEENDTIDLVIEKSKELLTNALNSLTPYKEKPEVIFYELSHRTDFKFKEPETELTKIQFNR